MDELCNRLASNGDRAIGGARLAAELGLPDARTLRKLIARARVDFHRHEILGVPGTGYFWAPAAGPARVKRVIALCQRMARCWFYIAALAKREGAAMAAVQLVFNFMEGRPDDHDADDLAALVAAEGTSVAEFLDRFVRELASTEAGRQTLADVGRRHAQLLLPANIQTEIIDLLDQARARLAGLPKAG